MSTEATPEEQIEHLKKQLAHRDEDVKLLTAARDQYKQSFEAQQAAHAEAMATVQRLRKKLSEPVNPDAPK